MKRRMMGVAAAAVGVMAFAACTPGAGGGDAQGLTWSMWIGSTDDQQAWEAVGAAGAEAAGVPVSLQGAPFNDYWTRLSTQLGSSSAPCIVSMQSLRLDQFASGLLPLDDLIAGSDVDLSEFDAGALSALQQDGAQYALPFDTGPIVLFYNRDAFAAAGVAEPQPGWTTAEFDAAAAQLQAAGQVAFATTVEDLYIESSIFAATGGTMVTDDGTTDVTASAVADGVDYLAGLVQSGVATRADGPDGSADDNAFLNGSAASLVGGPWLMINFVDTADFQIGVATLPVGPNGGGTYSAGSGFGISSTCSQPEQAFAAISAMTSEEQLSTLAEQGRAFPSRTASQQVWYDNVGIDGAQATFEAALASATPLPGSAQGDQLNQLLAQYGPQMVNGDRPAAEVLAEMDAQLNR